MRTPLRAAAAALILAPCVAVGTLAADPSIRQERVTFAKGTSVATIKGQLQGDATVDYLVRASAGQTLVVTLKPTNRSNYFNVLPPGSADAGMYNGQTGEDYTGMLPSDGDYTVRVYLIRAAARRDETSNYTLTIGVTGKVLPPTPASQDAVIPGTSYHAAAPIQGVPMPFADTHPKECQAFVIRRGTDGTATVEIKLGDAVHRRILFVQGKPVASDSMDPLTATREGDITTVKFGADEWYAIPDALVFGG